MLGARKLFFAVSIVLSMALVGSTAVAAEADPLGLTLDGGVAEGMGLGTDTIAVWVCDVGGPMTFTAEEIADWANAEVAPFFDLISRGRYATVFEAAGGPDNSTFVGQNDCLSEGTARTTDPRFSNAFVIDNSESGGGLGGSGLWSLRGGVIDAATLDDTPAATGRGLFAGGDTFGRPATTAHEVGHTLTWPHSGSSGDPLSEGQYDNAADLMSGHGVDNLCEVSPGFSKGPCFITHTLAFNRYTSGWIDESEVSLITKPTVVEIAGPEATGTQMALVPSADPLVFSTVEARPAVGYDLEAGVEGVMLHTVDQASSCTSLICWGLNRRQKPAVGSAGSTDHILGVGQSATVHGVTVTVEAATTDGFRVAFANPPAGCAMGPNPFGDVGASSFAFNDIGCIRLLGITTGTSPTAYSPNNAVTREQMAAFLGRLYRGLGNSCGSASTPFVDIDGSFAAADIACIFDLRVTTGTSPTTYSPAGAVTRAQMAAFLGRLWRDALGNSCGSASTPFTDIGSSFAAADIACIFELGITTGTSPTTYDPAGVVTREQMAAFLARFWKIA